MDELSGTRRYGFGIVGSGVIAKIHAEAVAMLPGARLVAVTDVAPESAQSLAGAFGCATEPDLDALLARDDVDVVSVCVPSGLHAEVGAAAAAAGKHLVIEKPIDVSLAAADRLIGAAAGAGVAVTAISQLFDRLHRLLPRESQRELWGMIGITEDLGVDDFGPAETFTLADARTVERWASSRGLAELSFWNVQDDNSAGSQLEQTPYEFSHILEPFTSSATRPAAAGTMAPAGTGRGATDPPAGNPRSVSCPVTIDPIAGIRTSVSCPSAWSCVAVDFDGRALALR